MRQVIHHVPDSHLNAYIRFKLALTESEPTIKPYDEKQWAELADVRLTPIEVSLSLLEYLHARWTLLLRALEPAAFSRTFRHPDNRAFSPWTLSLGSTNGMAATMLHTSPRCDLEWAGADPDARFTGKIFSVTTRVTSATCLPPASSSLCAYFYC